MRLGSRGSALALAQARLVAQLLQEGAGQDVQIVTIAVSGDSGGADSESQAGSESQAAGDNGPGVGADKSRWVDAIEHALLAGEIDLAVHSAKDVPARLTEGLALLGAPTRAAAEDVLCVGRGVLSKNGPAVRARAREDERQPGGPDNSRPDALDTLPTGARVGTSSLRRAAQLRAARDDLEVVTVAGNVDTRLRKLAQGDLDAIVLARAGLQRLGREDEIGAVLDPTRFVPSPGQGTLALEGRAGDDATRAAVEAITDERALACLLAERALAQALDANCNTPLGAHAVDAGCGCLYLRAWIGAPDGGHWIADELLGGFYDPPQLGRRVAERMLAVGARELLGHVGGLTQ